MPRVCDTCNGTGRVDAPYGGQAWCKRCAGTGKR
jgi:DnaJ-class molecular chaperone